MCGFGRVLRCVHFDAGGQPHDPQPGGYGEPGGSSGGQPDRFTRRIAGGIAKNRFLARCEEFAWDNRSGREQRRKGDADRVT